MYKKSLLIFTLALVFSTFCHAATPTQNPTKSSVRHEESTGYLLVDIMYDAMQ